MPLHIVMEQAPARHLVWLRRGIETSIGLLLIFLGWAALFALAAVIVLAGQEHAGGGTVTAVVGVLAAIVLAGLILGRRLVGRSRRLVLFLRRFGYTEATQALTFAALKTIGRSWRLVTLDDASVAPVGVSDRAQKVSAVGESGSNWARRVLGLLTVLSMYALGLGVAGMGAAIGYTVLHHRPVLEMVDHALGHHHAHSHGAPAVFAICFTGTIVAALVGMFLAAVNLAATFLFQPSHTLSVVVRRAEEAKVTRVVNVDGARRTARAVRRRAKKVFSPRLMVLHVDSDVWRPTVQSVADVASVVLIDVSEPTENLLWEISEVVRAPKTACVLVGQADRLQSLASSDEPLARRLAELLGGRAILAYQTDERELQRFARALRATLEGAVA